jgi:uncharacterized protein YndB with AHSA1/START domain
MRDIQLETWIRATPSVVFDATTTRNGLDAWWGKAVDAEPLVGHVIEFDHGLGELLRMRVTDLEPTNRVAWPCLSDFSDPADPASEWLGTSIEFTVRSGRDDPAGWLGRRLGWDSSVDQATAEILQSAGNASSSPARPGPEDHA